MSRWERARQTIRLLLADLEADGLLPVFWSPYWDRYVEGKLDRERAPHPILLAILTLRTEIKAFDVNC